ncbi:MAG: hydantoinase/oxoprolinase N-terminal domain-containing protein, partial [Planctomycetota bacterium]
MGNHDKQPREFWIDVGGTFTDCIARFPGGRLAVHKLLSTSI